MYIYINYNKYICTHTHIYYTYYIYYIYYIYIYKFRSDKVGYNLRLSYDLHTCIHFKLYFVSSQNLKLSNQDEDTKMM